jgi:hypothetical protein
MNPIGALYIADAIEDERRRFVEQRRLSRLSRSQPTDVTPSLDDRPSWRLVARFRRIQAADSRG